MASASTSHGNFSCAPRNIVGSLPHRILYIDWPLDHADPCTLPLSGHHQLLYHLLHYRLHTSYAAINLRGDDIHAKTDNIQVVSDSNMEIDLEVTAEWATAHVLSPECMTVIKR
jgi:hypothetical protein